MPAGSRAAPRQLKEAAHLTAGRMMQASAAGRTHLVGVGGHDEAGAVPCGFAELDHGRHVLPVRHQHRERERLLRRVRVRQQRLHVRHHGPHHLHTHVEKSAPMV